MEPAIDTTEEEAPVVGARLDSFGTRKLCPMECARNRRLEDEEADADGDGTDDSGNDCHELHAVADELLLLRELLLALAALRALRMLGRAALLGRGALGRRSALGRCLPALCYMLCCMRACALLLCHCLPFQALLRHPIIAEVRVQT